MPEGPINVLRRGLAQGERGRERQLQGREVEHPGALGARAAEGRADFERRLSVQDRDAADQEGQEVMHRHDGHGPLPRKLALGRPCVIIKW